jgi:sarcosine oxidase, subunit alpha
VSRLAHIPGEWIDRTQEISFTFEGEQHVGFAGDTISAALWARGLRTLGRSFKYHRRRGVLSLANHDVNTLVQAGERPNVRADIEEIKAGGAYSAVNTHGGVAKDRASLIGLFSRFLPVGFYYKVANSRWMFPLWEALIRNLSGLGIIHFDRPVVKTAKRYAFCDVLVIGGGPSGLSAALAAADAGASVILAEENPRLGGSGFYQLGNDPARRAVVKSLVDQVMSHANIEVRLNAYAASYYADYWVPLIDGEKMTKVRARSVIIASGAYEQPAVFRNNDLPGVMMASAAQRLVYRYAVQPAKTVVVLVANDDGYRSAIDMLAAGVKVAAVVDLRSQDTDANLLQSLRSQGVECLSSCCVYEAHAGQEGTLSGVTCCPLNSDGEPILAQQRFLSCDGLLMSVGWAPALNLLYQAGTTMSFQDVTQQFVPERLPPGIFAAGRVNGFYALDKKIEDGQYVGRQAANYIGLTSELGHAPAAERVSPSHPWPIISHPSGKNFIDFDEDLQLKDFETAVLEGFDNIELLKRFSTNGMGPSQGKHSNMNALRILARLMGKSPQQVGTTTARPFFHPVPMSVLAGRGFSPERRTPLHARHQALGAVWMAAGVWQRPEYYAKPGRSRQECIAAEVAAVRNGLGLIDVGTLGKLEVHGPDAGEFLERVYTMRYAKLNVGATRYAIMCDESGVVIDDGVVARLAPELFYFTTTTSGAATVYRELSRLNTIWKLNIGLVNVTGARSAVNIAGARCREVLSKLSDLDFSSEAFPYLAVREGLVAGIPARLMRVGFVGEWSYEIHVPAEYGARLWDALMSAEPSIVPFGVEAQRLLRLEKGHVIVGQDTDGLTNPFDIGADWAVKFDKAYFVGKRSLKMITEKPARQRLIGFKLHSGFTGPAPQECHLIIEDGEIIGRITSIGFSTAVGAHIGLAFVPPTHTEPGKVLSIRRSDGSEVRAEVVTRPFYDPKDLRQKEISSEAAA